MSIRLMSEVWEMDMKPIDKLVLLTLADHADDHGVCWPSQGYVARKSGCSRKTVNEKIGNFVKAGIITKDGKRMTIKTVTESYKSVTESDSSGCNGELQTSNPELQLCNGELQPSEPSNKHQRISIAEYEKLAELIFKEYPRQVGKDAAITKIIKAIKKFGFKKLMSRTKQYAEMTELKEKCFIPHPSTWFNQGRYKDDPDEWINSDDKDKMLTKLKEELKYERQPEKWQAIKQKIVALQ
jgi:hypothetical protein